jgi:hypothetical protein
LRIKGVPSMAIEWSSVSPTEHPGATGRAIARTVETGNIRARTVEYSPDYLADHWCQRGHVVFVLDGELVIELADGSAVALKSGMGYQVADDTIGHRARTAGGARVFIVD